MNLVRDGDQEARIATLEREMGDVNRTLYKGNGKPPLTERMAALEKSNATQTWLLRAILGSTLANIAAQIMGHLGGAHP